MTEKATVLRGRYMLPGASGFASCSQYRALISWLENRVQKLSACWYFLTEKILRGTVLKTTMQQQRDETVNFATLAKARSCCLPRRRPDLSTTTWQPRMKTEGAHFDAIPTNPARGRV